MVMIWEKVLMASNGQRPGMLLNSLQCTGQPSTTVNYPVQMLLVPSLRNCPKLTKPESWLEDPIGALILAEP